jgi:hypothetical protein
MQEGFSFELPREAEVYRVASGIAAFAALLSMEDII